jgi:hypothetical protein
MAPSTRTHLTKKAAANRPMPSSVELRPLELNKFKTRVDLTRAILSVDFLPPLKEENGRLLALVLHPQEGFVHLVHKTHLDTLFKHCGPYHISLCFEADLDWARWRYGEEYVQSLLDDLIKTFDGASCPSHDYISSDGRPGV